MSTVKAFNFECSCGFRLSYAPARPTGFVALFAPAPTSTLTKAHLVAFIEMHECGGMSIDPPLAPERTLPSTPTRKVR